MNKVRNIFLFIITLSLFIRCHKPVEGNGNVIEKEYDINDFNELNVVGDFQVSLIQAETPSLKLKMDENLIENTRWDFSGKTLTIDEKEQVVKKTVYEIVLTVPSLKEISLAHHAVLLSNDVFNTNHLTLNAKEGSKINMSLKVKGLKLNASKESEIKLYGETHTFIVKAEDKTEIDAIDFEAKEVEMDASGTSELKVFATKSLSGTVVENATVSYREGNFTRDFRAKDQGEVIAVKNKSDI